jgi:hypothetical protein
MNEAQTAMEMWKEKLEAFAKEIGASLTVEIIEGAIKLDAGKENAFFIAADWRELECWVMGCAAGQKQ